MSGSNVVPMPMAAPPAPSQLPYPWPNMMMSSAMPTGCCPPGGMDALLKCWCDIQAATAFISKVVIDLAQNDPAFQKALVDAIAASGSNIPLTGITNGSAAQPGQVGEFVMMSTPVTFPSALTTQVVTAGVLQPGDWDVWTYAFSNVIMTDFQWVTTAPTIPSGFSTALWAANSLAGGAIEGVVPVSGAVQALITVPTLIVYSLLTAAPAPGGATIYTNARRRR